MRRTIRVMITFALALGLSSVARAGGDWNDQQMQWRSFEDGLAVAKKEKKPICLIFFTEWCPHCTNYSGVFHDGKVVDMAKKFVMVRLDKDKNAELSKKYAPDGEYIPRTYFLSASGALEGSLHAPRAQYQYFYDEKEPASLLAGMEAALAKFK